MPNWKEPVIAVAGGGTIVGGATQVLGPNDWVRTNVSNPAVIHSGGKALFGLRRNGQGAAGYVEDNLQDVPGFHDLIDPTTARRNRGFEMRDVCLTIQAVGLSSFAFGIHDLLTVNDWTSLVGIGFEHGVDNIWKTFLKDENPIGGLARVVHQVASAITAVAAHELAISIDGWNKKITWLIDGVIVDSYAPVAPLERTGGSAAVLMQKLRYRGLVPAAGDFSIYRFGNGLAAPVLSLIEVP